MGRGLANGERKSSDNGGKKVIVFVRHEQSLLSELYCNDANLRAVFQLVIYTSVLCLLGSIVCDSLNAKRLHWSALSTVEVPTVKSVINAILIGSSLHLAGLLVYPLFKLWLSIRSWFQPLSFAVDVMFVVLHLLVVALSFVYVTWILWYSGIDTDQFTRIVLATEQKTVFMCPRDFPNMLGMIKRSGHVGVRLLIVFTENWPARVRLCMKSYSFIRENAYKVLYPWHKDDTSGPAVWYKGQMSPTVGSFSQYCYFLYAPTLLYRDHYPRSQNRFPLSDLLLHISLFVFSILMMIQFFAMNQVSDFNWSSVLNSLIRGAPLGILYSAMFNIGFMHSWMNISADVTGFSDRRFYESWWISENYEEFYRKWNIVPYHFNYEYVYRDIRKITNSKYLALFLMLFASSAAHEYILGITFGHAVPLVTLFFACLGSIIYILRFNGSFLMIMSVAIGLYLLVWNASLESQARKLCPREETLLDIFYPRLIECVMTHSVKD